MEDTNSILVSIKKMLGVDAECHAFDEELVMYINSVFPTLFQIGYDPARDFMIDGEDQTWDELVLEDFGIISLIKTYIYAKVRMLFDPPTSSFVLESLTNQAKEMEWRIGVQAEGGFDCVADYERRACSLRRPRHEMGCS